MEKETKILSWNELDEVIRLLKKGEIIAFPTDTVYGLAAIATKKAAFEELVRVKNRNPEKPFTLMCASLGMAAIYGEMNCPTAETMKQFFPGKVTALLKARKGVPSWVTLGKETVGIRVPDDKNVLALIENLRAPLLVPSANISDNPPLSKFEDVVKVFDGKIAAIIKGGCSEKVPSTIVNFVGEPALVREGPIPFERIQNVYKDAFEKPLVISLGSDHGGFKAKQAIKKHLKASGYIIKDVGTHNKKSCDYPLFGIKAAQLVANKEVDFGILVCTSGEGIMISANKVPGIRCGLGYDDEATAKTREHNNANMVAFGQKYIPLKNILRRVDIFLAEKFSSEEKHQRRVSEIE